MTDLPTKITFDGLTGEVQNVELTKEEIENFKFLAEASNKAEQERKAKEAARASALAKLAALGLTEEEIAAL